MKRNLLSFSLVAMSVLQASPQTVFGFQEDSSLQVDCFFEASVVRNFYSDSPYRYSQYGEHADDPANSRLDVPRAVASLRYDAKSGWMFGADLAIYHRATGSSYIRNGEEKGLWQETSGHGGSVALEQLWLEKSFSSLLNLRVGHLLVPIGQGNAYNRPKDYFSVGGQEGEATILPSIWHQTGISLWGEKYGLRYNVMLLGGLNSDQFSNTSWIHDGADSPMAFDVANKAAVAGRLDYTLKCGLQLGLSGYYGQSIGNSFPAEASGVTAKYDGAIIIGAIDFSYKGKNLIVRGQGDIGHLNDADKLLTVYNRISSSSPYHDSKAVSEKAYAFSVEAGYDILSLITRTTAARHQIYLFGRYEQYNPYASAIQSYIYDYTKKTKISAGVNYLPTSNIVVKAEYAHRLLSSPYNNEPSINLSIAFDGRLF